MDSLNQEITMFRLMKRALHFSAKSAAIIGGFLSLSYLFAQLSTVHGKSLPADYFSQDLPNILGLLNSEFFMGMIFVITLSIIATCSTCFGNCTRSRYIAANICKARRPISCSHFPYVACSSINCGGFSPSLLLLLTGMQSPALSVK